MASQALRFVILGIFFTGAIGLYIGGCVSSKQWLPMLVLIPAILACLVAYQFLNAMDKNEDPNDVLIGVDGWMFVLCILIVSALGEPVLMYRLKSISLSSLLFHLGGDVALAIGFSVFMYLSRKEDFEQI